MSLGRDVKRLQLRIIELQKENSVLRSALSKSSVDFCSRILEFVRNLHCSAKLSDVTFKTPEKSIPGHTFVLDARGGVWKTSSECNPPFIRIEARQEVCEAFICWLYKGELYDTEDYDFLSDLLKLAGVHELPDLVKQCESFLISYLNRQSCIHLYSIAHQAGATGLLEKASEYLNSIWQSISAAELSEVPADVFLAMLENRAYALHTAIKLGRLDVANLLFQERPIEARKLVNTLDESGLSPLYLTLELGSYDFAEVLIRYGADPNLIIGPENNRQPTGHFALLNGRINAVEFLVRNGYKLDVCLQPSRATLLHLFTEILPTDAQMVDYERVCHTILDLSTCLPTKDSNGNTPLHTAILNRNATVLRLFMEHPELFDLNETNAMGMPPLWYAICADFGCSQFGNLQSIGLNPSQQRMVDVPSTSFSEQLLRAGADVNFRFTDVVNNMTPGSRALLPQSGDSLLMACARCALDAGALFLLEHQCAADAVSTTIPGETAFHLAVEYGLKGLAHRLATTHKANPSLVRTRPIERPHSTQPPLSPSPVPRLPSPPPKSSVPKSTNPFDSDTEESADERNLSDLVTLSERLDPDGRGDTGTDDQCQSVRSNSPVTVYEKRTPLHLAIASGMIDLIELYLDCKGGIDPDWFVLDERGDSVFSLSLWSGRFDLAGRILVAANRQGQNQRGPNGAHSGLLDNVIERLDSFCSGPTLLHRAVEQGNLEATRFLLCSGANANLSLASSSSSNCSNGTPVTAPQRVDVDSSLICPLWCALEHRLLEIGELLVSHKAELIYWHYYPGTDVQLTLLHRTIYKRNEDAALFLIRSGCDVNALPRHSPLQKKTTIPQLADLFQPAHSWTPIHMASALNLLLVVRGLITSNRANVNSKDACGNTALHLAIDAGHNEIVDELLRCPALDCSVCNDAGYTAFHVAMSSRNVQAAQALMKRDSTLALQTDKSGRNFLHIALQNLDRAAIFFLIQTGMDVNQCVRDCTQYTPLHLAIVAGAPEDVLLSLILAGASITTRTPQKYTVLHLCVLHNRPEMLHTLIEQGANVNAQDAEMSTPLHLAIRQASVACLAILLSVAETDCGIVNICGQLPIHLIAEQSSAVSVAMLHHLREVRPNTPLDSRDASGNTPLLLAYRANNGPLCVALHEAGALLGACNMDGQTVFKLSRQHTGSAYPDPTLAQILNSIQQEPRWEDGSNCSECEAKFNLTCRKHHCRHCGRVLCTNCSKLEVPIVKFGIQKPVRVCFTCFEYLNNPLGF